MVNGANISKGYENLLDETNNQDLLNKRIFNNLSPKEGQEITELLFEIYNKNTKPFNDLLLNPVQISAQIHKLSKKANNVTHTMKKQLDVLETNMKNLKDDFAEKVKNAARSEQSQHESSVVHEMTEGEFMKKMMDFSTKVVKGTVDKIRDFLKGWRTVEAKRLLYVSKIMSSFNKYITSAA